MISFLKGFVIAFSMYSRIPMPKLEWDEKSMRYAMCFFPLVGALIGAAMWIWYYVCIRFEIGDILRTAVMVAIPILLTGGFHMDGFLDTIDALSSQKPKEEKLKILSDSHTGAFAIIFCVIYIVLMFGFMYEIPYDAVPVLAASYITIRAFSALSVVSFKMAKDTGLAKTFCDMSIKITVRIVSIIYIAIGTFLAIFFNWIIGTIISAAILLVFVYYRYKSYKCFGGITGDLCGYFLQLSELAVAFCIVGGILCI